MRGFCPAVYRLWKVGGDWAAFVGGPEISGSPLLLADSWTLLIF